MQLRQLHRDFLNEVKLLYNEHEAMVITSMVFEAVLGVDKLTLAQNGADEILKEWQLATEASLEQLRQHVPVQYVTGVAWFFGLHFKVNPAVLIPRPETEELVSHVISFCKANHTNSLLDIGTGSGCIPISIKKNLPALNVSAIDISLDALNTARANANKHAVEINWIQQDFLDRNAWQTFKLFDVIVSNPPYIPATEAGQLDKNVTAHEPHIALFVPDNNHLIFYENIALFASEHLSAAGKVFVECHEKYAQEVADLFDQRGFEAVVEKDFYEKERMVMATRSHSQ